jgi:hypothetical protein
MVSEEFLQRTAETEPQQCHETDHGVVALLQLDLYRFVSTHGRLNLIARRHWKTEAKLICLQPSVSPCDTAIVPAVFQT